MNENKILIFGGGLNQLTLIEACNSLGFKSIVIDPNINAPGKDFADVFEVVEPDDYNKTREVAKSYKVDGIATSQMQNPLRLMAKLADELGFIFNSPEIIERGLNKYLMKKAFKANNVPCANGLLFKGEEELAENKLSNLNFPMIIKPLDSHSSRGVYRANNYQELVSHIHETIYFSSTNEFLIEEFIEGPEYSIEAVTFKGKTTIVQYTEKIITPYPNVVELGHIQPATINKNQKTEIDKIVTSAIDAIGLNNTVTHTEVKLTEKGPVVIEIGPRMGGDFISSYLVNQSCGVNLDKATIQMSVGEKPDLTPKLDKYSYIKYLQLDEGKKVNKIGNWQSVLNLPGVVFANVSIKEGDIVPAIIESAKRPGFVIVEGNTRKEILYRSDRYLKLIEQEIELENYADGR